MASSRSRADIPLTTTLRRRFPTDTCPLATPARCASALSFEMSVSCLPGSWKATYVPSPVAYLSPSMPLPAMSLADSMERMGRMDASET